MQISATVGIDHIKYSSDNAARPYRNGIITVAGKTSLLKKAMFGVFEKFALPIDAFRARPFVVTHYGRPWNTETLHKFDERFEYRAVVVKFSVNEIARHYDKIGVRFRYRFGYIIVTIRFDVLRSVKRLFGRVKATCSVLRRIYRLRIGEL